MEREGEERKLTERRIEEDYQRKAVEVGALVSPWQRTITNVYSVLGSVRHHLSQDEKFNPWCTFIQGCILRYIIGTLCGFF